MPVTRPISAENDFLFGIKNEASYSAGASLSTSANYAFVYSLKPDIDTKPFERKLKNASMNSAQRAPGKTMLGFEAEMDYMFTGVAGTDDAVMSALEQSAGMVRTTPASTVLYSMSHTTSSLFPSFGSSSYAAMAYRDQLLEARGVFVNLVKDFTDDVFKLKVSAKGLFKQFTESGPASVTVPNKDNIINSFSSSLILDGTYDVDCQDFVFDYGNNISAIEYKGDQYGFGKVWIGDRVPTFTFTAVMDRKSNYDFIGKALSQATASLIFQAFGSGITGERHKLIATSVQFDKPDIDETDNYYSWKVKGFVVGDFSWTTF